MTGLRQIVRNLGGRIGLGRGWRSGSLASMQAGPAAMADEQVVAVTGFWLVANKHGDSYRSGWLRSTLRVNVPYVFFCDPALTHEMQDFRADLPTTWVPRKIEEFRLHGTYDRSWTHPVHQPSAELALIWLNKIDLVKQAAELNPGVGWFLWIDAGFYPYRAQLPPGDAWPRKGALARLPRGQVVYSHVQEPYHSFAGTAWMIHRSILAEVHEEFFREQDRAAREFGDWRAGHDQVIWTRMRDRRPRGFFRIGDGYGSVVTLMA